MSTQERAREGGGGKREKLQGERESEGEDVSWGEKIRERGKFYQRMHAHVHGREGR